MLKIFKKENFSTYVFTKSMVYVNRMINNILRKTTLVIKKQPKSYCEKFELSAFGYREIKSPRNCLEAEKRET